MAYVTIGELRKQVQLGSDATRDAELTVALGAAEEAIDDFCNRSFPTVDPAVDLATSRLYTARSARRVIIHDLAALDRVETRSLRGSAFQLVAADDVDVWPSHADVEGRPFTELRQVTGSWPDATRAIQVTGWFGWLEVPAAVKQAALLQASRFFQRRSAQFGVAPVPGLDGGGGMRLLARLDADVELMLHGVWRNPTRTPS